MSPTVDQVYADLVQECLTLGEEVTTRNSDVFRIIVKTLAFNSTPLISARKTAWKSCLREWEWFMSGSNNLNDLPESVKPWWKPWADKDGEIWGNYSKQFRTFYGYAGQWVDQIQRFIGGIYGHPFSRRNVITTWNTCDMVNPWCPITNCHGTIIQAFVDTANRLDLVMYQRSVDVVCGLPHNWFQYWAFLLWLAHRTGRGVGKFTWIGGDIHIYSKHVELARAICAVVKTDKINTPNLLYTPTGEEFKADDFSLDGEYKPVIETRAEMVV